jgi:hypothetical protein
MAVLASAQVVVVPLVSTVVRVILAVRRLFLGAIRQELVSGALPQLLMAVAQQMGRAALWPFRARMEQALIERAVG